MREPASSLSIQYVKQSSISIFSFSTLSKIYVVIWSWFHLYWILVLRWLASPWFKRPYPSDDVALGYGDRCLPGKVPGLASKLLWFLTSLKYLRHQWTTFNFGSFQSTSEDWLPPSLSKQQPKGRLFLSKLSSFLPLTSNTSKINSVSSLRHTIVICLGFNDPNHISPIQTLHHLQGLATSLSPHFGFIYICTIPDAMYPEAHLHTQRNTLLREWLLSLPKSSNIKLGAELDRTNREYTLARLYSKDLLHFNHLGYIKMAKDLALAMEQNCRKLEFEQEKKFLK